MLRLDNRKLSFVHNLLYVRKLNFIYHCYSCLHTFFNSNSTNFVFDSWFISMDSFFTAKVYLQSIHLNWDHDL